MVLEEQGGYVCHPVSRRETINISAMENVKYCDLTPINLLRLVEMDEKKLPIGVLLDTHPYDAIKFCLNPSPQEFKYNLPPDYPDLQSYLQREQEGNHKTQEDFLEKKMQDDHPQILLADLKEKLTSMEKAIANNNAENKELKNELTSVKEELTITKKELTVVKEKLTSSEKEIADNNSENKKLKEELTITKKELTVVKEKLTSSEKEIADNKKVMISEKKKLKAVREELTSVKEEQIITKKELCTLKKDSEKKLEELKVNKPFIVSQVREHIRNTCNKEFIDLYSFLQDYPLQNDTIDKVFSMMKGYRNVLSHTQRPHVRLLQLAGVDKATIDTLMKSSTEEEESNAPEFLEEYFLEQLADFLSATNLDKEE